MGICLRYVDCCVYVAFDYVCLLFTFVVVVTLLVVLLVLFTLRCDFVLLIVDICVVVRTLLHALRLRFTLFPLYGLRVWLFWAVPRYALRCYS